MPLGLNPTLIQIRDFFGGPGNLRAYYRGGPYVPDIPANANISTDPNQLRLTQFSYADKGAAPQPLTVNAPDVYQQINNGTASQQSSITASGGAGGYTYSWTNNSSASMSLSNANRTATFSTTRNGAGSAIAKVTDAAGTQATHTISVDLNVGVPI